MQPKIYIYSLIASILKVESGRLIPRPFENWNEASIVTLNFRNLELIVMLVRLLLFPHRIYLYLLCIAGSVHLFGNVIVSSSWLPHDHIVRRVVI